MLIISLWLNYKFIPKNNYNSENFFFFLPHYRTRYNSCIQISILLLSVACNSFSVARWNFIKIPFAEYITLSQLDVQQSHFDLSHIFFIVEGTWMHLARASNLYAWHYSSTCCWMRAWGNFYISNNFFFLFFVARWVLILYSKHDQKAARNINKHHPAVCMYSCIARTMMLHEEMMMHLR